MLEDEADGLSVTQRHSIRAAPADDLRRHDLRGKRGRKSQETDGEESRETHAEIGWEADVHLIAV